MSEEKTFNKGFVIFMAAISAIGGLLFGFDTGVISGALLLIKEDPNLLTGNATELSEFTQEIIVSITVLFAGLGAIVSGAIIDKLGRKKVIIITSLLFAVASVGLGMSNSVTSLVVWRAIVGVAIGVASYSVPTYISEISPSHVRGTLVSAFQLAITIGIFSSYLVDLGFADYDEGWRWMFMVGLVPSAILGVGMFFLPETPRWLMAQRTEKDAREVLDKVGEPQKEEVLNEIKESIQQEEEEAGSFKELFANWVKPALICGVGVMFLQQFIGINTIIYYSPTIFESAGYGADSANRIYNAILPALYIGAVNVIATIISMFLVDKWGRKPLLYLGLTGMIISLLVMGSSFTFYEAISMETLQNLAFYSMIVYIPFFAISLGPIAWILISEVFPTKVRGLGASLATMTNWFANFIISISFLSLGKATTGEIPDPSGEGTMVNLGGPFLIYAVIGVIGLFFVKYYVPETKGRSLEYIEEHLQSGKSFKEFN